jgi:hypothetical protein
MQLHILMHGSLLTSPLSIGEGRVIQEKPARHMQPCGADLHSGCFAATSLSQCRCRELQNELVASAGHIHVARFVPDESIVSFDIWKFSRAVPLSRHARGLKSASQSRIFCDRISLSAVRNASLGSSQAVVAFTVRKGRPRFGNFIASTPNSPIRLDQPPPTCSAMTKPKPKSTSDVSITTHAAILISFTPPSFVSR